MMCGDGFQTSEVFTCKRFEAHFIVHRGVSGSSKVIILNRQISMSILHRLLALLLLTSYVCCFWVTAKLRESTVDRKLSSVSTSGEVGDFISAVEDTLQSRQRYGMLLEGVKPRN